MLGAALIGRSQSLSKVSRSPPPCAQPMPLMADMTSVPSQALPFSLWLSVRFRAREMIELILAANPRRFVGWHWLDWLKAASLAAGRKFWHRRRERESDAVPATALISLLLLPGIALDSSRPAVRRHRSRRPISAT